MPISQEQVTVGGKPVTVNKSDAASSYRLVHDGSKVISLFEATGITHTKHSLFTGTRDQCLSEVSRLGLTGVESFVESELRSKLDSYYAEMKTTGETEVDLVVKLLAQTDTPTNLFSKVDTAAADIAAERVTKGEITLKDGSDLAVAVEELKP